MIEAKKMKKEKLATLGRVLSWTHNRRIMSLKILCREKKDEVVKYALSRSVSPAVIVDYETRLIPKRLLRDKLNEIYAVLESGEGE